MFRKLSILIFLVTLSIGAISQPKVREIRGTSEAIGRGIFIKGMRIPIQDTICNLLNYNDTADCQGSTVFRPQDQKLYIKTATRWEVISFLIQSISFGQYFSVDTTDPLNPVVNINLPPAGTEADPVFSFHVSAGITQDDLDTWGRINPLRGVLLPSFTKANRDLISSPAAGLLIYQTDNTPGIRCYNGSNWVRYTETVD